MLSRQRLYFLLFWFAGGIFLLFYIQFTDPAFFKRSIIQMINELSLSSRSADDFMDKLSNIFKEDKDLQLILIHNNKGKLIGSIYGSNRISKEKYTGVVEHYGRARYIGKTRGQKNQIKFMTLFEENIVLHFRTLFSLSSFFTFLRFLDHGGLIWALVFVAVGGYLSYIVFETHEDLHYLYREQEKHSNERDSKTSRQKWEALKIPLKIENTGSYTVDLHPLVFKTQEIEFFHVNKNHLFEEQLRSLLERVSQRCLCEKITFYLWDDNGWQPYLQKQGKLFVKGKAIGNVPSDVRDLSETNDRVVTSPGSMAIAVQRKKELIAAFYFEFKKDRAPSRQDKNNIYEFINRSIYSLMSQRDFEQNTIDKETSFYTSPYFYTTLDEKISAGKPFITLIFDIQNIDRTTSSSLQTWTRFLLDQLQHLVHQEESIKHIPQIYRVQPGRFIMFFSYFDGSYNNLTQFALNLEGRSEHLKMQVFSSLVPCSAKIRSSEVYLKIVEQSIWEEKNSRQNKQVA